MTSTTKKTLTATDGCTLYYETEMSDALQPTLFFLHGAGGDLNAWQFMKDQLMPKGFSAIAMDLRGHGYSGHPRTFASYHIDNVVEDIKTIILKEKIKTVHLIGHCYGAVVALHFAIKYPEQLSGLVVISGTYRPPSYATPKLIRKVSPHIANTLAWISPYPLYPGHSYYRPGAFHPNYNWFGIAKTIIRNSMRSWLLTGKELLTLDIEHKLAQITAPTLIIAGGKDTIFPLPIAERMHRQIKNSDYKPIAEANHMPILNNVHQVAEHVYIFLQKIK